jgi:NAD(P)-dependent dehydrogenase (short-subunit alcohol dehydrogenase family)
MREVNEQIILITGATDGLGKKVAFDLAGRGVTILLHGRDPRKGEAMLTELRQASGNTGHKYYNANFVSLANVRRLAGEIMASHDWLDVLINNAGIGSRAPGEKRQLSEDGYELRFAVNYLAPFLLTRKLLPLLQRSAPSRIINVSSIGQQALDFDNLMLDKEYDDQRAYRQSKLAQVMFTIDLAEELKGSGVTVNSLHPASLMNTNMVFGSRYFNGTMSTVEQGAAAVEYLAVSPELEGITGEFFDGQRRSRALPQAYDKEARQRLKEVSEKMIKE